MSDLVGKYVLFDFPLGGPDIFKVEGHVAGTLFFGKFADTESGYVFFDIDDGQGRSHGIHDTWESSSQEKAKLIQHKKLKGE